MAGAERSVETWWADVRPGRVVRLDGAPFELLRLSLDPLPDTAPAVLAYRPHGSGSVVALISSLLDELDQAAVDLFPLWLPEAQDIRGPGGAGVPAVRTLAFESAATSRHFGPFLADLAERALRRRFRPSDGFAPVVIAAGLARVFAASYARDSAALLVDVPVGLSAEAEGAFVGAAEWIAHHGGWGVWLAGAPLQAVDRVETVVALLPPELAALARELPTGGSQPADESPPAVISAPPVSGIPRADSPAEMRLESALSHHDWANGRTWNETYHSHALAMSMRLDLWWAAERCVVEIDGPEHRGAVHYAADRQRDVLLQLDGHAVLRFTNAQVLADTQHVVSQIERFIRGRRSRSQEKSHDVN